MTATVSTVTRGSYNAARAASDNEDMAADKRVTIFGKDG
jgi:hypothetical protein